MKLSLIDRRLKSEALPLNRQQLAFLVRDMGRADWTVNLVLVDDREMAELKGRWYGEKEATDVLSFSYLESEGEGPVALEAGEGHAACDLWVSAAELPEELIAGEVVLAPAHVALCARAGGWDLACEWALLLVHGALHILGWRHAAQRERRLMQAHESALLQRLGFAHPALCAQRDD
jgi:rRNA maturation RNase YbeY